MTVSADLMALRALCEGAPASFELLALASGRSERLLRKRAQTEGWKTRDGVQPRACGNRVEVLTGLIFTELERTIERGVRDDAYDKARIDALGSMLKMVEKMRENAAGEQDADAEQAPSDEDMAAALERIDERIRSLAEELAGGLGAGEPSKAVGAGD